LFSKLDELSSLTEGWNGYSVPAPVAEPINSEREFLNSMREHNHVPTRVAASAVGGVGITCRFRRRKAYVEFLNNGLISALFADDVNHIMYTQPVENSQDAFHNLVSDIEDYLHG